jgi:hypothetical protein
MSVMVAARINGVPDGADEDSACHPAGLRVAAPNGKVVLPQ